MGYSQVALEDKILHMYPEILQSGISPKHSFDDKKNTWVVEFVKGTKSAIVFLDKKDADLCMDNTYCEAFKTEMNTVISNLEKS